MKVAFLCPYFGKFPKHIQLWINSCSTNKNSTFFIFTDDRQKLDYPSNFVVRYLSLEEMKDEWQTKFDFQISLNGAYKIGDYKPCLGFLFEELIEDYDAWAHLDVPDEIVGDVDSLITEEAFCNNEKLMVRGHMSIFRNAKEVNRRFMEDNGESFNYKDILSSADFFNFEELGKGSINWIYRKHNYPMEIANDLVADLSGLYYDFRRSLVSDDFGYYRPSNVPSVYARKDGKTYGYFLENNRVEKKEYLYVHFKRRKMDICVPLSSSDFMITQNAFLPFVEPDAKYIKQHSKKKLIYKVYIEERKKAIKRKLGIK